MRTIDRLAWFVTRHRTAVLAVCVAVAIVLGAGIPRIRGDVILQHLFPYNHPYLQLQRHFFEVFGGGGSNVVIALKTREGDIFNAHVLGKLRAMTNEVVLWDEVYRISTISIASRSIKVVSTKSKGEIAINPLMWPEIPRTESRMEQLKAHIFSNPAYNGSLVSRDGTAALLLTEFRDTVSYDHVFRIMRKLVRDYSDERVSIHVAGFPMLMGWIYSYRPQIIAVSMISVGLMILILCLIFRSVGGIATPIIFSVICSAMGLGFIGWSGINFSPLLYVLAFLVGARMLSHAVQLTHRYFEELERSGTDRIQACYETTRAMLIPNWAGAATDAAGFLVLLFAKIILMQLVAVFMTFWMICIALCGVLTPIICSFMPLGSASRKHKDESARMSILDRVCVGCARYSMSGQGRYVVAALCAGTFAVCAWQAGHLKIGDPSPGSPLLWPEHQYNRDQALIDRTFNASSENFVLFYEGSSGSRYNPLVMYRFEAFSRHMKERLPDIFKSSSSIIELMKMMNVMYHDGDHVWYQLPTSHDMMMSFMGFIKGRTDRGTLSRFIALSEDKDRAQIILFFSDHTSENLLRIRQAAYDFFNHDARAMKTEAGEFLLAGGRIGMEIALNEEMKRSHAATDLMVLLAVFVLCALFYKSIVCGLMLTLPLILANLVAFATMAFMDIGLSINTLPVAAVGVGVGVDFAIYIYSRVINEYSPGSDLNETILTAVRTSGKAVVYTGLTMILPILTWYFVSDLKFQAQMGMFLALVMGTNVILALTLHPLMLSVVKPRFIIARQR